MKFEWFYNQMKVHRYISPFSVEYFKHVRSHNEGNRYGRNPQDRPCPYCGKVLKPPSFANHKRECQVCSISHQYCSYHYFYFKYITTYWIVRTSCINWFFWEYGKETFFDRGNTMPDGWCWWAYLRTFQRRQESNYIQCGLCEYKAVSKPALSQHVSRIHGGPKNFICKEQVSRNEGVGVCGQGFLRQCDMDKHIRSKHLSNPVQCDVCGSTSRNEYALYNHKRVRHNAAIKEHNNALKRIRKWVPSNPQENYIHFSCPSKLEIIQ